MPEMVDESKHLAEYIIRAMATDSKLYQQIKQVIQSGRDADWTATDIMLRVIMFLEDRLNCAVSLMPPDMRDYYAAGGREYSEDEALSE